MTIFWLGGLKPTATAGHVSIKKQFQTYNFQLHVNYFYFHELKPRDQQRGHLHITCPRDHWATRKWMSSTSAN